MSVRKGFKLASLEPSYVYLYLLVALLLLLDSSSVKLVNCQLEAVGAVLSVVPVTSILTTAGLVGVKLAALSRLLQALGYDQAYLKSGNSGTAAQPIGLQANYAYMFPYVPGLNISVREEHGIQFQNDAARLRDSASGGGGQPNNRKTFPAMGLPGDYESQLKPFRGSETLRDIFKNAGLNVKFPNQQQISKTIYVAQKGKGQQAPTNYFNVDPQKSNHKSINLQPPATATATTPNYQTIPAAQQQQLHHLPSIPIAISLSPPPSQLNENGAQSAFAPLSPPAKASAVTESRPQMLRLSDHKSQQQEQHHQRPQEQSASQSDNRMPSSSSSLPPADALATPQLAGQQGPPRPPPQQHQQQLHIPQTHALQSQGQNSQVSVLRPNSREATHLQHQLSLPSSSSSPPPAATAVIPAIIPQRSQLATIQSVPHSSPPPPPLAPAKPLALSVQPLPPATLQPQPHPQQPPAQSNTLIGATVLGAMPATQSADPNAVNQAPPIAGLEPQHTVPQHERFYQTVMAALRANLGTRSESPPPMSPSPSTPQPMPQPHPETQQPPALPILPALPALPPPPQQQQQRGPPGVTPVTPGLANSTAPLLSGQLVRPPHHGIARIPQRMKSVNNFEDYNNIMFGAGASLNSLQFSTSNSAPSSASDSTSSSGSSIISSSAGSNNNNNANARPQPPISTTVASSDGLAAPSNLVPIGPLGGHSSSSLATGGVINILPNGHSPPSGIATNLIPLPFFTDGPPPFHDEMDQNEFNLVNMRRRKRDLTGGPNTRELATVNNLAGIILSRAQVHSTVKNGGQQKHPLDANKQMHENFGMPAVNVNNLRRRRSLGSKIFSAARAS